METLISAKEMAGVLNVSPQWIYNSVTSADDSKRLPHIKVGKRYRFDPKEVIRWFKNKEAK